MKRVIFLAVFYCLTFQLASTAQVIDGVPYDSTTVEFTNGINNYIADTAALPLWQIGHSHKVFFGVDSDGMTTMMTDTVHPYRTNANNFFIIKVPRGYNTIIDFWHKFQTDTGHAGGIVEFSLDYGTTWQNVKGDCNADSEFTGHGVITSNFYTFNDTLITGEPAFTGSQDTLQYSRFQFFDGFPLRMSSGSYCAFDLDTFYVRFRFVSDTTRDSLAGWIIDSIKIENDNYGGGGVKEVSKAQLLHVYPNPSNSGLFTFPALDKEQEYKIEIYNTFGELMLNKPYEEALNLIGFPVGSYFYKVYCSGQCYSGQIIID